MSKHLQPAMINMVIMVYADANTFHLLLNFLIVHPGLCTNSKKKFFSLDNFHLCRPLHTGQHLHLGCQVPMLGKEEIVF